jgi:signal transduction histidine kinase
VSAPAWLIRRASSLDPRLVDGTLAAALTVWALIDSGVLREPARTAVLVAMTVAIAWRRRAPVAVLTVEVAGLAVVLVADRVDWPAGIAFLIAAYSAALHSHRQFTVLALLIAAGAWVLAFGTGAQIPNGLIPFLLLAPAWLAGIAMRHRGQLAEAAAARANRLEQEQEAALRAERARIARELHDVVTHSVSVMVLQTGAAQQILDRDGRRAHELLQSVETSGRSALEELRRLLGLLSEPNGDAPLSPQPGVTEIPTLVEQVERAGLPVKLCVQGQPRVIAGGVSVAAYRIVQEALTNVLNHGGGASTTVVVRWAGSRLELEIRDRGAPQHSDQPEPGIGRGLAGMRERAATYGGTLDAHPEPGAGYLVRARLPLEPEDT